MSSFPPVVSVLTPTIHPRRQMLAECRESVISQWTSPGERRFEHLILLDRMRYGCAVTMNKLARAAKGEWLLPLADDDLLLPGCLENLLEATGEADVVYPPPVVEGEPLHAFVGEPPVIPSLALIRASLWKTLGGYEEDREQQEDRDFWTRALNHGARFVRYEGPSTWTYRFHKGNKSRNDGVAS